MKHSIGFLLIGLQIVAFAGWWFASSRGAQKTLIEIKELEILEKRLADAMAKKSELEGLLAQWEHDPFLVEKSAREHLGLSRSGERMLVF
ncbi:MAG: hypothetical protein UV79_C0005G0015 [candidate division TM6 bacterium GW2011_GWF2_43_17]|nr:MAG: hypothetical protein UV79_C0005G0015 [candidate division TM6 bacterium GW2011_GWF2_43_17]HAU30028.1 hypothetical protein [Candidatus Dependentiae bacterium]